MSPLEIIAKGLADKRAESQEPTLADAQGLIESINQQSQQLESISRQLTPTVTVKNFPKSASFPTSIKTPDVKAVVEAVKGLANKFQPTSVDLAPVTTALAQLQQQNTEMIKALQSLEITPQVQVAAPKVEVPAVDLAPLTKALAANKPEPVDLSSMTTILNNVVKGLTAVQTTIKNLRFPVATTQTDPLIKYTPADIDDAGTIQYFGYISADGSWYIRKFDTTSSYKTIRFSFGTPAIPSTYSTNWTNRASLTYALWST